MDWQLPIALLLVAAAAYSLWRRSRPRAKGGCDGCDPAPPPPPKTRP